MKKSLKFYLILMGTVGILAGCGVQKPNVPSDAPEVTGTPSVTEVPEQAEKLHPIVVEGVDYLSVEGLALAPGTEIAMLATDSENKFYDMVKSGAVQAVADLNQKLGYSGKKKIVLTFAAPKAEDAIEQINIIDQFLDKAPDALCVAFTDATACKTQLEMAKNNGIRLIAFDAADESKLTEAFVGTDNTQAATLSAKKMYEHMEDGSKIAILAHNAQKQTGIDRYKAITREYTRIYDEKSFRFVDVVYVVQDGRTTEEIFEELLGEHPDLAGIICTDTVTTEMAVDYVRKQEVTGIKIMGFDFSEKIAAATADGTLLGTVAQDPYNMGYATVVAAARSVLGMSNAENIYSDHMWIDAENLDSEKAQSLVIW